MPFVGMMSVFDWSEVDNVKGGWTGREWFVVNKADVLYLIRLITKMVCVFDLCLSGSIPHTVCT